MLLVTESVNNISMCCIVLDFPFIRKSVDTVSDNNPNVLSSNILLIGSYLSVGFLLINVLLN